MFKLQRPNNRPSKPKERVDFKFSNFQALQVPKGWDRLVVSVIFVETGKTIARLSKALVRNGSCQWMETLSESIYMSNDMSSKGYEECLVKLVVTTGSARSSPLGEVILNMAQYTGSRVSTAVSQPLIKCSYGTILQVKVQCLTRRSKVRDEESNYSKSQENDLNVNQHDRNSKSNRSHGTPSEDFVATSHPLKLESKETSQSATGSVQGFDSMEGNALRSEVDNSHTRQIGGSHDISPIPDYNSAASDSPSKQSPLNSRLYLREDFQNEAAVSRSSMTNIGSSKNLLEAAEDTIEELRAEAKMWERNARKLMVDLDVSRKEFSDLSKKHAELAMELSDAYAEHDGTKREVEKLKIELQNIRTNQATEEDTLAQSGSLSQIQKEQENEIKYQQELNDKLGQQLKQSQESNIELVSFLQELEQTIEQQKIEIENISSLKLERTDLENSIATKSEGNRNLLLQLQQLQESEKKLQADVQMLEEALRDKVDELENERNSNSQILSHVEKDYKHKISVKEEEIPSLEASLSGYVNGENSEVRNKKNENNADLVQEIKSLREKVEELEKDCAELTDENLELLYKLKDLNRTDISKCASSESMSSEHPTGSPSDESEVSDPKYQTSHVEEQLSNKVSEEVQNASFESSEYFTEIVKQIDISFHLLEKPWCGVSYSESENCNDLLHGLTYASEGNTTTRMPSEYIVSFLQELNKLLEMRITEFEKILRNHDVELKERNNVVAEAKMKMEDAILKVQELEKSKVQNEEEHANLMKGLDQKKTEIDLIVAGLLSKEMEIEFLLQHWKELGAEISELQQEKNHLEQNMELVVKERNISSECMENLQNELTALRDTVSSHMSANGKLKRSLEELERRRDTLENAISGLQEENLQLQETVLGLEAQVRQLEDEKEFCLQETDNFKPVAVSLQDEIEKLNVEMDTETLDLKQKAEDMQKQWSGAQKQCEYLKGEKKTLQASAASFMQENEKLQNSNLELKRVNQELQNSHSALVAQLSESKKSLSDCTKKIKSLEDHLFSVLDEFTMRENSLKSEIDALIKENGFQKERLAPEESLHQILLEKMTESESLQFTRQVSDAHNEWERISFEVSGEVSRLLVDKAELQASLQEAQSRAELTQNELNAALQESELKFEDLTGWLAASQQSHERLMADHDRVLKLLANYKKSEEKLKTNMNDLELKLTISDCERQQLTKEMSALKVQLQSIASLQDEVSSLKNELKECRLDKGKLELALQRVSGDYEELKAEKISFSEKICVFQNAMSEFEGCRSRKLALEERLLEIEKEMTAKEILCLQNADLKNEIAEIKRANVQFQQKMYRLEEERDECLKKAQALEGELKVMKERNNFHREGACYQDFSDGSPLAVTVDHVTSRQLLENEISEGLGANNKSRVQRESNIYAGQENYTVASKKSDVGGEVVERERYERTKSSLETELRDLRERYLEMSLKYAEVEAQREDLVMKLKATRGGRRWFS